MRLLFLSLVFSLLLYVAARAGDDMPTPAPANPSNFNNMLTSLSKMLASTNPTPTTYQEMAPGAGQTPAQTYTSKHVTDINSLPPLPGTEPPPLPATYAAPLPVTTVPQPQEIAQPQADVSRLSPQTRRLLQTAPSGIGSRPRGAGGSVSIQRGDFDPEYGRYLQAPIDAGENNTDPAKIEPLPNGATPTQPAPAKAKIDINVKTARDSGAGNMTNLLEQGLKALESGQYESSIAIYKAALRKDPRSRDALFGLATAYQKAGQTTQAREVYAKLLRAYPNYEPGINNLLVMAGNEAPADALRELEKLSARNPNFAALYEQKGSIYAKMGDNINAKKNLLKALSLEPDNIIYRYNLAIQVDKMGEIAAASQLYNQILDQNAKGVKLPVERSQITERLAFISTRHAPNQL